MGAGAAPVVLMRVPVLWSVISRLKVSNVSMFQGSEPAGSNGFELVVFETSQPCNSATLPVCSLCRRAHRASGFFFLGHPRFSLQTLRRQQRIISRSTTKRPPMLAQPGHTIQSAAVLKSGWRRFDWPPKEFLGNTSEGTNPQSARRAVRRGARRPGCTILFAESPPAYPQKRLRRSMTGNDLCRAS